MTKSRYLTTLNLDPFLRNAIGMDRVFESMMPRIEHANSGNYPPYNIIGVDDDNWLVEIAVAGFDKDEIDITVENGQLVIKGDHVTVEEDEGPEHEYLHRGISSRSFERTFTLADHVEVKNADIKNGILTIALEREVPEALKPKRIEIK